MGNVPAAPSKALDNVMDKVRARRASRKDTKMSKSERGDDMMELESSPTLDWRTEELELALHNKNTSDMDQQQHKQQPDEIPTSNTKPSSKLVRQASRRKSKGEVMMATVGEDVVSNAKNTVPNVGSSNASVGTVTGKGRVAVESSALQWSPLRPSDVHQSIIDIGGITRLRELLYCFYTQFNFEKLIGGEVNVEEKLEHVAPIGVAYLNKKLKRKYGKGLEDLGIPFKKKSLHMSASSSNGKDAPGVVGAIAMLAKGRASVDSVELGVAAQVWNNGARLELELYFLEHDPRVLRNPQFRALMTYVDECGILGLDEKLAKSYGRSLNYSSGAAAADGKGGTMKSQAPPSFLMSGFRETYQAVLVHLLKGFYGEVDPSRLAKNDLDLDYLTRWTLKNGIPRLNTRLLAKYGQDLAVYLMETPFWERRRMVQEQSERLLGLAPGTGTLGAGHKPARMSASVMHKAATAPTGKRGNYVAPLPGASVQSSAAYSIMTAHNVANANAANANKKAMAVDNGEARKVMAVPEDESTDVGNGGFIKVHNSQLPPPPPLSKRASRQRRNSKKSSRSNASNNKKKPNQRHGTDTSAGQQEQRTARAASATDWFQFDVSEADVALVRSKKKMRPDMTLKQDIDLFLMRHDPIATLDEIDDVMYKYGMVHGRDALNTQLRQRYGKALSDVTLTAEYQSNLAHGRTNTFATRGNGSAATAGSRANGSRNNGTNTFATRGNGSAATAGSRANGSRNNGSGASRTNDGGNARMFTKGAAGGGFQTAAQRERGYGTMPMEAVDSMLDMGKAHYEQLLNRSNLTGAELDFIRAWQRLANDASIQGEIPLDEV